MKRLAWLLAWLLVLGSAQPGLAGRLVITDPVPASSLNPFDQMDAVSHRLCVQIFEHLTLLTGDGRIVPGLAESWTQPKPGVYRFKLRRGVKFHDGRPLETADVIYSLNQARKGRLGRLLKIDGVRALESGVIELVSPSPSLLAELSFAGFIVPRGSAETLAVKPIGTGPYRFVRRDKDGGVELARFGSYWRKTGASGIDEVVFNAEPRDEVRRRLLETGRSQIITDLNPHLKLSLLQKRGREEGIRLYSQQSARVFFIAINSLSWPGREAIRKKLADPRVRRALNLAVDKKRIINVIMLGNGLPLGSCLAEVIPGSAKSPPYAYDPKRARELLAEAGAIGLRLRLAYSPKRWFGAEYTSRAVAKYLQQVGLKVELVSIPWPEFLPTLAKEGRKFDLYYWAWGNPILDPSFTLGPLLRRDPFRPWNDERFNRMFDEAEAGFGLARLGAFTVIDDYLHDSAPWIFLFQKVDSYAAAKSVVLKTSPTEIFRVADDVRLSPEAK